MSWYMGYGERHASDGVEGRLVFSDAKTGTDLRDAKVWGCAVSAPKKARKGHKYILRLDLRAGRVDSRDDSKYVLSTTTGRRAIDVKHRVGRRSLHSRT